MNPSTNETQTSPSLADKAEAIYTTLEQATSILDMLAVKYIKTPDYPVFMALEDELLGKAKQQLNELIGELPNDEGDRALILSAKNQDAVLGDIVGKAYSLVAISKTINQWAAEEPVREVPILMLDSGDMVSLSELAQTLAQAIVDSAQDMQVQA